MERSVASSLFAQLTGSPGPSHQPLVVDGSPRHGMESPSPSPRSPGRGWATEPTIVNKTMPPSPFFREPPKKASSAESDALAIADLLRSGSSGGASTSAPTSAPGPAVSAAASVAARYGRHGQPTPAEVDAALGGLPELLSSRGLSDEAAAEEEPFGMKRVTTKKHLTEDDTCESWKRRKKHFFIFSAAGKPIYARYGDENALAGFMARRPALAYSRLVTMHTYLSSDAHLPICWQASMQAMISFVKEGGDNIRHPGPSIPSLPALPF